MSIRLTPSAKDLFNRFSQPAYLPTRDSSQQATANAPKKSVTARLESTTEGICPYCGTQMRNSKVEMGEVWLCENDRHVVPLRNT